MDALGHAAEVNAERHLKPAAEMARLFAGHEDALAATLRVLDAASAFSLAELRHEYPEEILEPGQTPQQTLVNRVAEALRALAGGRRRGSPGAAAPRAAAGRGDPGLPTPPGDPCRRLRHHLGPLVELAVVGNAAMEGRTAVRQAEVGAAQTMLTRTAETFGL